MKSCLIGVLIIITSICYGQELKKFRIVNAIGAEIPIGKEFAQVYNLGVNTNFTIQVKTIEGLYIGPIGNLTFIKKNITTKVKDRMFNCGGGLDLIYLFEAKQKVPHFYFFGVQLIREQLDDRINATFGNSMHEIELFQVSGNSFSIYTGIEFHRVILKVNYFHRKYNVKYDDSLKSDFETANELYPVFYFKDQFNMDLSSISLTLGYRLL